MTIRDTTPAWPEEDRPLLPFLPMVYVAWADGELSPEEVESIRTRLEDTDALDDRSCSRLARWLDPEQPPSARELQAMLRLVRQAGSSLGESGKTTLVDLGRELAALSADGDDETVADPVLEALDDLQSALGVVSSEAARDLLEDREEPSAPPVSELEPEPEFDPAAMVRLLDGRYRETRQEVRTFLSRPEFGYEYGLPLTTYREKVLDWLKRLAEQGWGAISFPESCGGEGDLGKFIAVFETLAYHDISLLVKFGVQFGLFGGSIYQLGTERHHLEYLPRVGTVELPGCFAMTERGHGSNVREIETTATYDPDAQEFVVHTPRPSAMKEWIGNAARHGRMATVFAQLDTQGEEHGVHALLVPIRDETNDPLPGITIEDDGIKEGLNGVDNGRLGFDHVRVPRENLLDRFASVDEDGTYSSPIPSAGKRFFTMLGTLVGGRISVAYGSLSAAKSGLAIAVRYGAKRRQFGPAGKPEVRILDYLSHQRRLMPRLAAAYAYDFALEHVVDRYLEVQESESDDSREVETLAAGMKALVSWFCIDTLQECRECCGGQGYLAKNRLGPLKADLDVFATFEGDNTVLLQLVAKGALTEFRQQFSELQFWNVVKHLAHRASTRLAEANPVVVRKTDEDHLRDPEFHEAAFRFREERLLWSAAGRLKHRIDDGMDSFQAFNEVQDHLLKLARAWTERVVVEQFAAAVRRCEDESLKPVLQTLSTLNALWRMEADMAWFLRSGYVESNKARAIRDLNNTLVGEVRRHALPLVESFGIPDELLAAPIAFEDDI